MRTHWNEGFDLEHNYMLDIDDLETGLVYQAEDIDGIFLVASNGVTRFLVEVETGEVHGIGAALNRNFRRLHSTLEVQI